MEYIMRKYIPSQTFYDPSPLIDLSDPEVQERLSHPGLSAFFKIMGCWKIAPKDASVLLGIGESTYYEYKKNYNRKLNQDMLTRISLLIGIFKSLHILHNNVLADKWMTLANTNPLFGGKPPLAYIKQGGMVAMLTLRRLLDARRGGV